MKKNAGISINVLTGSECFHIRGFNLLHDVSFNTNSFNLIFVLNDLSSLLNRHFIVTVIFCSKINNCELVMVKQFTGKAILHPFIHHHHHHFFNYLDMEFIIYHNP